MDLDNLLNQVNSKETFIYFIKALKEDKTDELCEKKNSPSSLYSSGHNGWENDTLVDFLDSIHAFSQDSKLIKETPDWKTFALIFYAGKFYE